MTQTVREKDLDLSREDSPVFILEFAAWWILIQLGNARLTLRAPFEITWPDGESEVFDPKISSDNPASARLLSTLMGARITESVAGIESAYLRIAFDNGVRLNYTPTYTRWEDWEVTDHVGRLYIAATNDQMMWFNTTETPKEPDRAKQADPSASEARLANDVDWDEGDEPRLIDLEFHAPVYGITMFAESLQLEMRSGVIFFAGLFSLALPDGRMIEYDPRHKLTDCNTGLVLAALTDRQIVTASLDPEASRLAIRFDDGTRLEWEAESTQQGLFHAKGSNKREFWSRGDGSVYWYGGPEDAHPKFLSGGPRKTD